MVHPFVRWRGQLHGVTRCHVMTFCNPDTLMVDAVDRHSVDAGPRVSGKAAEKPKKAKGRRTRD